MDKPTEITPTKRSKVRTKPDRASYDFETVTKILDDTFLCHISFVIEGQPFLIPTCYGIKDSQIFFHGGKGGRMLKHIKAGSDICIAVSLLDGIVLARSAMHHSVNYRSVIIFGKAKLISEAKDKAEALKVITEHIVPGRWSDVREPNEKELNATSVFSFNIAEVSAKMRSGSAVDAEEDMNLDVWAGVLPLRIVAGEPIRDHDLKKEIPLPEYLVNYKNQPIE